MPAVSPSNLADHTLRVTVYTNGSPVSDAYPLVSIRTFYGINRIPTAEITFQDGSVDEGTFPISDSADFVPGAKVRITAGYEGVDEADIFAGTVVKQELRLTTSALQLVVTCKHDVVKMTFNKKERFFTQKKDSDIMSTIFGEFSVTATVSATTVQHESVFQKMATDWDFILARADFSGMVVSYTDDKVIVGPPVVSGNDVLRVAMGESIQSFHAELNAEKQPPALSAMSWDPAQQTKLTVSASEPELNEQGNITPATMASDLGQVQQDIISGAPMTDDALQLWADAQLLRQRLSALKGSVTFLGNAAIMPNQLIKLEGVGERFNGSAYVSSVSHSIEDGMWNTTVSFGLENRQVADLENFSYNPAAGQMPAIHGLQVAVVKQLNEDPAGEFRIKVTISSSSSEEVSVWARVANFYATSSAGSAFLPEVSDEVVIGFLESNPDHPVILGSLYSKQRAAENTPADNNNYKKGITTKSKLKILFDDEKKVTTIETPAGNKIKLDDDGKTVDITDQNNNSIKMTSSGVEISSAKDLTLTAKGSVKIDATNKLSIASKADVSVAGLNIEQTANVGFKAKGNATAEISASGQTVVKGAIVMIN